MKRRLLILGIGSLLAAATAARASLLCERLRGRQADFARRRRRQLRVSQSSRVGISPPTMAAGCFESSGRNGRTRAGS